MNGEDEEDEDQVLRDAAQKEYEEKMAEVEPPSQPEPPPEAAAHEGYGQYRLLQDANIAHKDYKAGDGIALTSEEYQELRKQGVHCEAVEQQPS